MKTNKIVGLLLAVSMLFTLVCPAFAADVTVTLNKDEYKHGELVEMETNQDVTFRVKNQNDVELFEATTSGNKYQFRIPETDSDLIVAPAYGEGTYKIVVDGTEVKTFLVKDGGSTPSTGDPQFKWAGSRSTKTGTAKDVLTVKNVKDEGDLVLTFWVTRDSKTGSALALNGSTGYTAKMSGVDSKFDNEYAETTGAKMDNKNLTLTFKRAGKYYVHAKLEKVGADGKTTELIAEESYDFKVTDSSSSTTTTTGGNGGGTGGITTITGQQGQTTTTPASGAITAQPSGTTSVAGGQVIAQTTGANAFMVNVVANGVQVTEAQGFDPIKVTVPYTPQAGQNTNNLAVVDMQGNIVARAVYEDGAIKMATNKVASPYQIVSRNIVFNDVYTDWAIPAISALAVRNVVNGVGDNAFDPDRTVTRAEFTKMIVTMFDVYDASARSGFSDVEPNAWYNSYVATAEHLGITNGRGDGTFDPNANISRQEMSAMLYRAATTLGVNMSAPTGSTFVDDAEIFDYAKTAVYSMQASNVIKGVGDNAFDPQSACTRAQGAVAIYNMLVASL